MSGETAGNSPGLCPVEGQKPSLGTQTWSRNYLSSLFLGVTKNLHHIQCWLTNQSVILLRISCPETTKAGSGPTNFGTEPSLVSSSAISLPRTPECPGTQYNPTACRIEIPFNAFCNCWTNGDLVLTAWRAFKVAWLSEQILTYFSGLLWNWIS